MTEFGVISIQDFADSIGKPVSTVYSWRRRGHMPERCFKVVGRTVFVREKEALEWLAA